MDPDEPWGRVANDVGRPKSIRPGERYFTAVAAVVLIAACVGTVGCFGKRGAGGPDGAGGASGPGGVSASAPRSCLRIEAGSNLNLFDGQPHVVVLYFFPLQNVSAFQSADLRDLV